jgi:hypothetical protein
MTYEKKQHKILSGSLNLLPPSDLTSDEDFLSAINFRVDQAGNLRSRAGSANIYSGLGAINSHHKGIGNRYNGGGTSVYRNGINPDTGYDGNPPGLASFKGYEFIFNKSRQRKDNGSAFSLVIPAAPSLAPTVGLATEISKTAANFNNTETWTASSGLTLTFDSVIKQEGSHSLKATFTAPGVYTATYTPVSALNLNLYPSGQTGSNDDKFRIWVKVADFKQVRAIRLLIDVSSGANFDTDYYIVELQRKRWKRAQGGWVQLEIRRQASAMDILVVDPNQTDLLRDIVSQNLTDRSSLEFSDLSTAAQTLIQQNAQSFERIGSTAGRDWSTVTAIRLEIEAQGATDCYFDALEVFGSVDGTIEGRDVQYYYTYVTADEIESNPSPVSTALKFNRRAASLSGLTPSGDTQVTGKYIYRTGGTLGAVYRVNSTPLANATTTYTDRASDEELTTRGIRLRTDHDAPPAAAGCIGPFFGRLIAYNSTVNPNRFWWSKQDYPWAWPGAANTTIGNWADVGPTTEPIYAATMHNRIILFYKSASIWRLIGDPDATDGVVEKTRSSIGCVGPRAVCQADDGDYFVGAEGVYFFNGDSARKISTKIDPIFKGQTVTLVSSGTPVTIAPIASGFKDKTALVHVNGRLYLSYTQSAPSPSTNDATLIYDIESQRWYQHSIGYTALANEEGILIGGTATGMVNQLEVPTVLTDAGSAFAVVYQSKYFDLGIADAQKTFEDFVIDADCGSATLTLTAYLDNGSSSVSLGTISGSGRQKHTRQFDTGTGSRATNISIRISGSTSSEIVIYGMWLHYYAEARSAKSFDTDEMDFGVKGVKLIRQLEFDIENSASVGVKLLTDLPGNQMVSRLAPLSITAGGVNTTRRVVPLILSTPQKGFLHRIVLDDTTAQFSLYGLRAEIKPIGDYVIAGEIWTSDEINWGSKKPKTCRALQIELENTADVIVKVFSDLPGGVMAQRGSDLLIAANSNRRIVHMPFASNAEYNGYLWRVTLTSTSDFILYDIQSEVKEIGTYISGANGKLYDSGASDWDSERVKLIKEIQLDYEAAADLSLTVWTDLPGDAIATRSTQMAQATSGRESLKFRMPGHIKGRLYKVKITSTADFILYTLRANMKQVGAPFASAWAWVEFPIEKTTQGIWGWAGLPVERTPSGSDTWRWVDIPVDKIA